MRLLSLFALSAFLFGANLSAHHEEGHDGDSMGMSYKCKHHKHHLKKKVFKHILLKNGVDEDTANNILADVHALKMKIKHKIKKVLKATLRDHDEDGGCHKKGAHRLKKMVFKKILAKNGVDEDTTHHILADLKELKMKIKHKIKNILRHAADAE